MIAKDLRCKNCEATLDVTTAVGNVVKCPYCGSTYTVSKSSDDVQSSIAFAEGLLDVCDFDKAYTAFQKAAGSNPYEPEAYFGMALAANKIQYLKDFRKSNGLQPICHEINGKKFSDDANYKKALSLATPEQLADYSQKAAEIDRIKSEFAALKAAGVDYDCFLCVKVTDAEGKHTEDSHIAEKIYHSLKEAGYAPFYSEYDIHGQTGADYEARILYALFMSESMFLICTDESYLQTPWVKNEYTRFINMMSDEQKERESLTVVFKDKPIEKIPGLAGRIQGISMNSFDALQRILSHVEAFRVQAVPELKRKEYASAPQAKKSAVRQSIVKRSLASLGGGAAITVSDKSLLANATGLLERGDFATAIKLADALIKSNASNSDAYRLRFLAENGNKTRDEFINCRYAVPSFDSLEKAIASADGSQQKTELYDMLFRRVQNTNDIAVYNEFVALPNSSESAIKTLTNQLFTVALKSHDCAVFDTIIKTVSDTDEYIRMNTEFARALFEHSGETSASRYYKNVLGVDEGNGEALWHVFVSVNGITDVFGFFSRRENYEKAERGLFGYGYNEYAMKKLFTACIAQLGAQPNDACSLADFLLSLIPKNNDKHFKEYLKRCRDKLMAEDKPTLAKRYNDRLLAEDNADDVAHFNACLINHGYSNPLSILRLGADVLDDPEFRAAFDIYPEKYPDKPNPYMDIYLFVSKNTDLIKHETAFSYAEKKLRVRIFELKDCREDIIILYRNMARSLYKEGLSKYGCTGNSDVFALTYDVSQDPIWREAYEYANACGLSDEGRELVYKLKKIIEEQGAESARKAAAVAREEELAYKRYKRGRRQDRNKSFLHGLKIVWRIITFISFLLLLMFPITMLLEWNDVLPFPLWSGLFSAGGIDAFFVVCSESLFYILMILFVGIPVLIAIAAIVLSCHTWYNHSSDIEPLLYGIVSYPITALYIVTLIMAYA